MGEFTKRALERLREVQAQLKDAESATEPDADRIKDLRREVQRRLGHFQSVQRAENL